ncbi:MAG: methyltransferase domain-containing protein [Candidatus Hodarchaeota archaeon]
MKREEKFEKMEQIKDTFENAAIGFEKLIVKLVPFYDEMVKDLILIIPFEKNKKIDVIDLGCGTGTLSLKIKKLFPNAQITCMDMTKNMLELAKIKLSEYENIEYILENFYTFNFNKKYDLAISSLALHHLLTPEDKKKFYQKIFNSLKEGGWFYNLDILIGPNDEIQNFYMKKWTEFLSQNLSKERMDKNIEQYYEEDSPESIMNHLKWLEEAGFRDVDVIRKYYNFGLYGGKKIALD